MAFKSASQGSCTGGSPTPSDTSGNPSAPVTCNLGDLVKGGTITVTLLHYYPSLTATAQGNEVDPNPGNNQAISQDRRPG